jgi:imidazolonepropionase-like amidohydrolase
MVANGVLFARDTGMPTAGILEVKDQLNRGALIGPEIVVTGTILDGEPALIPSISLGVSTTDAARAAVRELAQAGVDMIKVYSRLDADAFLAAVDEAHALGLKVAGHVPDSIPIEQAAAAGLDSSEHLFGFDKLVGRLLGAPVKPYYAGMGVDVVHFLRLGELEPAKLREALDGLRLSGLSVCPTVVTFEVGTRMTESFSGTFPGSEYVSQTLLDTWRSLWGQQTDLPEFVWQVWAHLVVELHRAGIPLMVGTDLSTPGALPGFSVHDEMAIWQDAGIPAADVLRGATLVPARFMGLDDRLGSIGKGKTASMILLRANPLEDVRNAREIESVFLRGRYYDRKALDHLLEEARDLAKR